MKIQTGSRIAWVLLTVSIVTGVAFWNPDAGAETQTVVSSQAAPGSSDAQASKGVKNANTVLAKKSGSGILVDPAAIEDLRKRRAEIDTRDRALDAREAELKARERALGEELVKLEGIRADINKGRGLVKKQEEERLSKVVETLESMSPKAASKLMTTLDDGLAVIAMQRLDTAKLAKIMNLLDPERAAGLAERLTGTSSTGRGIATTNQTKGGEKSNGNAKSQSEK